MPLRLRNKKSSFAPEANRNNYLSLLAKTFNLRSVRAFTIIELLIVIGIVAVLAVAALLVLNPTELLKQARDSQRLSDLSSLNSALGISQSQGDIVTGSSNTVYVSIADISPTCANLGLPSGWVYHCVASSTYKNVNGQGWIPVNFASISFGSPLGVLPVDPVNTTSSSQYYTYTSTPGGGWELTSQLEANKYLVAPGSPHVQRVGSSIGLTPNFRGDMGLVGYWTFDEGSGTTVNDSSGNGNTGAWNGTGSHWTTGKVGVYAGQFNGTDDYVDAGAFSLINSASQITVTAWINPTSINPPNINGQGRIVSRGTRNDVLFLQITTGTLAAYINNSQGATTAANSIQANTWQHIAFTYNSNGGAVTIYINGAVAASGSVLAGTVGNTGNLFIGQYPGGGSFFFQGQLDDVRIYNRALSAAEISAIYNATR